MYTTVHQPYPYSELDLGAMSSVAAGELVGVFGWQPAFISHHYCFLKNVSDP